MQDYLRCFLKTFMAALVTGTLAHQAFAGCFDFSKRVSDAIDAPQALKTEGDMSQASGHLDDGRVWAGAEGVVDHSTSELFQDLITHRATRSHVAKQMNLKTLDDAKNDLQQTAEFTIKPFPLMTVKWLEHWTYNVTKGSVRDPETVVVAYEKTAGTSHIQHLCGTLTLKKIGAGETRVTLYEEVKATRRTEQDTLHGVTGTLREMRELKIATKASPPLEGVKSATTLSADSAIDRATEAPSNRAPGGSLGSQSATH